MATGANVTTAGILVTAVGVVSAYLYAKDSILSKKSEERENETADEAGDDDTHPTKQSTQAFPWEVEAATTFEEQANDKRNRHNILDAPKELDFLSSMTFANGGLRAPSCPCCI